MEFGKGSLKSRTMSLVALTFMGCASGGVGPRLGMDIPVSGANVSGDVTSSSSSVGFIGGATFDGYFNDTWGLRTDPQIRTVSSDADFAGSAMSGATLTSVVGTMSATSTFVDIPLLVSFKVTDSTANIVPFFCIGGMISIPTSVSTTIAGTQTVTSDGQTLSAPFADSESGQGIGDPFLYLIFSGGVRIPISSKWEFRAEARLNQVIAGQTLVYTSLYTSDYRYNVATIDMSAPSTTLGITAGMHLHL